MNNKTQYILNLNFWSLFIELRPKIINLNYYLQYNIFIKSSIYNPKRDLKRPKMTEKRH